MFASRDFFILLFAVPPLAQNIFSFKGCKPLVKALLSDFIFSFRSAEVTFLVAVRLIFF
jgi:hypothetical protein